MAVFPQGKTRARDRTRGGERKVFDALARNLEDDYTVWHDIPIMGSARQPDFVILHPQRGLLILEVKEWRRQTIVDANPMQVEIQTERGRISVVHPLSQARAYALDVHRLFERHPELCYQEGPHSGKVRIPWGWGAALTHIKRSDVESNTNFLAVFDPQRTLLAEDFGDEVEPSVFQERLWGMFAVQWRASLTLPQLSLVRGLLFPELRIGDQAEISFGPSISALVVRDVLEVMDLRQEEIARTLGEGHRLIHGPAGSGKTMLLIFRAVRLQAAARVDKPILVLCYNRALAARIDAILRIKGVGPAVQVRTFHSWAQELVRTYQLGRVDHLSQDERYDALAQLACEGISSARVPRGQYTAILIDEAHDLVDDWLAAAAKMVDPTTKSLLVLYDDAQSIYQKSRRKFNFSKLGIEARGRTEVLRINYRNTREVLAVALECARPILAPVESKDEEEIPLVVPESAGRSGPVPVLFQFDNAHAELLAVAERITELISQGQAPNEIAVIGRYWPRLEAIEKVLSQRGVSAVKTRALGRGETLASNSIVLTTLHSSKGLEFPVVFLLSINQLDDRPQQFTDEVRLLYVGMTRATHNLHLSAFEKSPFSELVDAAIRRL